MLLSWDRIAVRKYYVKPALAEIIYFLFQELLYFIFPFSQST